MCSSFNVSRKHFIRNAACACVSMVIHTCIYRRHRLVDLLPTETIMGKICMRGEVGKSSLVGWVVFLCRPCRCVDFDIHFFFVGREHDGL